MVSDRLSPQSRDVPVPGWVLRRAAEAQSAVVGPGCGVWGRAAGTQNLGVQLQMVELPLRNAFSLADRCKPGCGRQPKNHRIQPGVP